MLWLEIRQARLREPIVSFGEKTLSISASERKILLDDYRRHNNWTFLLLWFAVAVDIIFGGVLFSRGLSSVNKRDLMLMVGDVSLAGGAFHLYRRTSTQLEKFVKMAR